MHVKLGGEVTVQDRVDVLQVVPSRVLVQRVGLWLGSVPAATSTSHREGCCGLGLGENGRALGASHELGHQRVALFHVDLLVFSKDDDQY